MPPSHHRCLVRGAKQIVTILPPGSTATRLVGPEMSSIAMLEDKNGEGGYSLVINNDGLIEAVDTTVEIEKSYSTATFDRTVDATGKCVIPGFVDAHTHPVWAGDRVHEFAMKLAGATYLDIHAAGGGIHFTVQKTREASEEVLFELLKERIEAMVKCGTTSLEAKSGYGLDSNNEIKMLRVLEKAKTLGCVDISSTFCGAHAVPKGSDAPTAMTDVIEVQIPAVNELNDSGELNVENIDVFCEKGVFDRDQTKQILEAGIAAGLAVNFHGDELNYTKSGELAAEVQARAISHVEHLSKEAIPLLAESGTVAVVLPSTAYLLRLEPPPVRKMIEQGMCVALGSDFNPNAYCYSMPIIMNLACIQFRMSMEEALVASTLNAAASIGRGHSHGALLPGRVGDLVVINSERWEHVVYQIGCHSSLIHSVVKNGKIVYLK